MYLGFLRSLQAAGDVEWLNIFGLNCLEIIYIAMTFFSLTQDQFLSYWASNLHEPYSLNLVYPNIQTSIYVNIIFIYILETYQYDELGWAFSCCCHLSNSDYHQCQLWLHDADDWSHFPMADRISFWWPLQVDEQSQTAQWFDLTKFVDKKEI
jgi:hypothetical protein